MRKSNKKGFTIVELVIVIAVIAILAAVLIPTFAGLIQKANESKDTQLVKNLNTALAADNKEHKTMTSALEAAAAFGYDVGKINASATGKEILWDSENDVFCYYDNASGEPQYIPETTLKNSDVATYKLWKIYTAAPTDQKFSIYWNSNANFTEPLTVGFDAGKNTAITELTYTGVGTTAQNVVIRTNSFNTELNINAPFDEANHFGKAKAINIFAIKGSSYNEYGEVFSDIKVQSGNLVVNSDAKVGSVTIVDKDSDNTATVAPTATIKSGAKVDAIVYNTTNSDAHITLESGAKVSAIGRGSAVGVPNDISSKLTNNTETAISEGIVESKALKQSTLASDTTITTNSTIENITINQVNKTLVLENVIFSAAADKKIIIDTSLEGYDVLLRTCIFDKVPVQIDGVKNSTFTIENCIFTNTSSSVYCLSFSNDGAKNVSIRNCEIIDCGRGILLRTPTEGNNYLIDNCVFTLSTNTGVDKARSIQIATSNYYYAKQSDPTSLEYYKAMSGAYSANSGSVLNGKISITNNTFSKASYGIYIYEAQSSGGFSFGNSSQDKLFESLSGNIFGDEVIFKYGCSDIGDGRSYTDKGYNTGLISSVYMSNSTVLEKRNTIAQYNCENYWDQMRALKELDGKLK